MVHLKGVGTQIACGGQAVLLYVFGKYRRAYVVSETADERLAAVLPYGKLPLVRERLWVLGFFEGRRIDILKNLVRNLEALKEKEIYEYGAEFWLEAGGVVSAIAQRRRQSTKRAAADLAARQKKRKERLDESDRKRAQGAWN